MHGAGRTVKQGYVHVCIDRLSRSLSRDGTDTACSLCHLSTTLCIDVVRLREENARMKGVVEELSKSSVSCTWGHNIIKIHFVSAYMYIYGCNLAAYVTSTSLCTAHIGVYACMYVILAVYCVALAGCIVMILLRSQHCKHGYNRTRLNSECMHHTHSFRVQCLYAVKGTN